MRVDEGRERAGDPPRPAGARDGLAAQRDRAAVELGDPVAVADQLERMARQGERVDDVDLGAGADVVLVDGADDVAVLRHRRAAPGVVVHRDAAPLHLGAHGAVHQHDPGGVEPGAELGGVSHAPTAGSGRSARRSP